MASQAAASIASTSIVTKDDDISSSESNQTTNVHEVTIHVSFNYSIHFLSGF